MARNVSGKVMPPHLRPAVPDEVAEIVGYLQEVLRYCAPDRAGHGWARMCMYRASDAMDAVGHLAGLIAAQLERGGEDRAVIQHMLRADQECLRTAVAVPLTGERGAERDLRLMPEWLHLRVQGSVTRVVLRLSVPLRHCGGEPDRKWPARCLFALSEAMDELGRLIGTIAALHANVMDQETLGRYQHLFQQRSRTELPGEDDRAQLAGLLGLPYENPSSVWYFSARAKATRPAGSSWSGMPESTVATALTMLGDAFHGQRWERPDGNPQEYVRTAALACLHGLTAVGRDDEGPPLYWLSEDERRSALAVAAVLAGRTRDDRWR
ncbi:hypothetical protein [Streptomyces rhizosphaericola]|uniref:hypothetical protein n=1 Tax=Streptomyces rhizosphaericola TaxID=2564098 RepID=UPI003BF60140